MKNQTENRIGKACREEPTEKLLSLGPTLHADPEMAGARRRNIGSHGRSKEYVLFFAFILIVLVLFLCFTTVLKPVRRISYAAGAASGQEEETRAQNAYRDAAARSGGEGNTGKALENGSADPAKPSAGSVSWKEKFADRFSEVPESGPDWYRSPDVAIRITTVTDDSVPVVWHVADIYVTHLENFRTAFAGDRYARWAAESVLSAAERHGAILCMNGDYADAQKTGLLVRNGELYLSEQTRNDICVLYADGTVKTYGPDEYWAEDIIAASPWQVWKFGPALLDAEGMPLNEFNTSKELMRKNPRSGFGYYEPGHYCFVVVDGRQSEYSRGMGIERFAQLFSDLGCKAAYNLDGGQSSVISFNGQVYNHPCKDGRDSGDFLMICELPE